MDSRLPLAGASFLELIGHASSVKHMSLCGKDLPSTGMISPRDVIALLWWVLPFSGPVLALPDTVIIPETVVTAERGLDGDPVVASWRSDEIAARALRTIDELLATDPSFSLYRRQSSVFGHPTSAGVSLRGTGATATARSLVLRDGIPQNDPFGGWIPWARYNPELLSSVRIVPSTQAAVWGNQSPAGIVHLTGRELVENRTSLRSTGGSHGTRGLVLVSDQVSDDTSLAAQASVFTLRSDGFYGLQKGQRGIVDRPLGLTTKGAELRMVWRPGDGLAIEPSVSFYEEERGNGTILSRNDGRALDFSLRVTKECPSQTWQALAYYQRRDFEAFFSAVDETRATETPALDQFDVPGEGIGGGVTATVRVAEAVDVILGADLRYLNGETNEQAGFVNGTFLRLRRAGGEQFVGGFFARAACETDMGVSLEGSARIDLWALRNGGRVERRPVTGVLLRDARFSNREGTAPSLSGAFGYRVSDSIRARVSAGTAFRLPTINELYRPFRVRSDITEANAGLDPERFFTVDAGVEWTPSGNISCGLNIFHHWIDDAIANVPLTDPVEAETIAGFLPPGGVVAQRRNVEEARVWGVESRVRYQVASRLACNLRYLFSQSEFTRSPGQPLLEGKSFPQSPAHRVVAGVEVDPLDRWHLFGEIEFGSGQYDDALAGRRLDSWWTVRIGGHFEVSDTLILQARVENLFDEEVATGLSSSGLQSIGLPRSFWLNVSRRF